MDLPVNLFEDNQATISITENHQNHQKTKHIGMKYHYIRDLVSKNFISLAYCPTDMMLANIFTKSSSPEKFVQLRSMLGMMSSDDFRTMREGDCLSNSVHLALNYFFLVLSIYINTKRLYCFVLICGIILY